MSVQSIVVCIRVRPLSKKEAQNGWKVTKNSLSRIGEPRAVHQFDHVFDAKASTEEVYNSSARTVACEAVRGMNGTVFAYGQTSSGKTYTMKGDIDKGNPGVIPLAIRDIFQTIQSTPGREYLLRVTYLEIYNEVIKDLLQSTPKGEIKIREDTQGNVCVEPVREVPVQGIQQVLDILEEGAARRNMGATAMNEESSRSHTIFQLRIESRGRNTSEKAMRFSVLNLVDLAGSERVSLTNISERKKEGTYINLSLLTLGRVINVLHGKYVNVKPSPARHRHVARRAPKRGKKLLMSHIPFRESKLTRILKPALGGNTNTVIIATVTPAVKYEEYTKSTLEFAGRARSIKNKVSVNELVDDQTKIARLKAQVEQLKKERKNRSSTDNLTKHLESKLEATQSELERSKESQEQVGRLTHKLNNLQKYLTGSSEIQAEHQAQMEQNFNKRRQRRMTTIPGNFSRLGNFMAPGVLRDRFGTPDTQLDGPALKKTRFSNFSASSISSAPSSSRKADRKSLTSRKSKRALSDQGTSTSDGKKPRTMFDQIPTSLNFSFQTQETQTTTKDIQIDQLNEKIELQKNIIQQHEATIEKLQQPQSPPTFVRNSADAGLTSTQLEQKDTTNIQNQIEHLLAENKRLKEQTQTKLSASSETSDRDNKDADPSENEKRVSESPENIPKCKNCTNVAKENSNLSDSLSSTQKENSRLQHEIDGLSGDIQSLVKSSDSSKQLHAEIMLKKKFEQEAIALKHQKTNVKRELQSLRIQLEQAQSENSVIHGKARDLEEENEHNKVRQNDMQQKLNTLKLDLGDAQHKLNDQTTDLTRLRRQSIADFRKKSIRTPDRRMSLSAVNHHQQDLRNVKSEIQKVMREKTGLQKRLLLNEKMIEKCKGRQQESESKLKQAMQEKKALSTKLGSTERDLSSNKKKVDLLKKELEKARKSGDKSRQVAVERNTLKKKNESLSKQLEKLTATFATVKQELDSANRTLHDAELEQTARQKEIWTLTNEQKNLNNTIEDLDQQLRSEKAYSKTCDAKLVTFNSNLQRNQKELATEKEQTERLNSRIDELTEDNQSISSQLETESNSHTRLKREKESLDLQLTDLKASLAKGRGDWSRDKEKLMTECEKLEIDICDLKNKNSDLGKKITDQEKNYNELSAKYEQSSSQMEALTEKHRQLTLQNSVMDKKLSRLGAELQSRDRFVLSTDKEKKVLDSELENKRQELSELKKELVEKDTDSQNLIDKLDKLQKDYDSLKQLHEGISKENAELKVLQTELLELRPKSEETMKSVEDLSKKLEEERSRFNSDETALKTQYDNIWRELGEMRKRNVELMDQLTIVEEVKFQISSDLKTMQQDKSELLQQMTNLEESKCMLESQVESLPKEHKKRLEVLQEDHQRSSATLKKEYGELVKKYDSKTSSLKKLIDKHQSFRSEYTKSKGLFKTTKEKFYKIRKLYDELKSKYDKRGTSINVLQDEYELKKKHWVDEVDRLGKELKIAGEYERKFKNLCNEDLIDRNATPAERNAQTLQKCSSYTRTTINDNLVNRLCQSCRKCWSDYDMEKVYDSLCDECKKTSQICIGRILGAYLRLESRDKENMHPNVH